MDAEPPVKAEAMEGEDRIWAKPPPAGKAAWDGRDAAIGENVMAAGSSGGAENSGGRAPPPLAVSGAHSPPLPLAGEAVTPTLLTESRHATMELHHHGQQNNADEAPLAAAASPGGGAALAEPAGGTPPVPPPAAAPAVSTGAAGRQLVVAHAQQDQQVQLQLQAVLTLNDVVKTLHETVADLKETLGACRQDQDDLKDRISALEARGQQQPPQATAAAAAAAAANPFAAMFAALTGGKAPAVRKKAPAKRKAPAQAGAGKTGSGAAGSDNTNKRARPAGGSQAGGSGNGGAARPTTLVVVRDDRTTASWPQDVTNEEIKSLLQEFDTVDASKSLCITRIWQSPKFKNCPLAVPHRDAGSKKRFITKGTVVNEARRRGLLE